MGLFEIIKTANHNLFRNKVRTFLTILAIFVGSFTIILNVAINTGVNSFIDEQTDSLGGDDYIMITSSGTVDMMSSMMSGSGEPVEYNPNQTASAMNKEQLDKLGKIDGLNPDDFYIAKQIPVEYITSKETDKNITSRSGLCLRVISKSPRPPAVSRLKTLKPTKSRLNQATRKR